MPVKDHACTVPLAGLALARPTVGMNDASQRSCMHGATGWPRTGRPTVGMNDASQRSCMHGATGWPHTGQAYSGNE